jgi:hypothetical protein
MFVSYRARSRVIIKSGVNDGAVASIVRDDVAAGGGGSVEKKVDLWVLLHD